jgi:hypothetical protein
MLSSTIYFFCDSSTKTDTKDDSSLIKDAHHIVSNHFFSMNEIAIANKIRDLNTKFGFGFRFYIFDSARPLRVGEIATDHLAPNIMTNIMTNIMKSSGMSRVLLTFPKLELAYFDAYLSSLSSSKKYIYQLIEGYRALLGSLNLLVSNQIIHNSLNFNTIVVHKESPILTNFSFSVDLQNSAFDWSQYFLLRKLDKFCPVEFYLLQYQVTNKQELSMYNIETIIKEFSKDCLKDSKTDINLSYFVKYTNKSFLKNLEEALKYWNTWDNYALSMVYLDILNNTFLNKDNKFISDFMKLLVGYINLEPSKRGLFNLTSTLFEDMIRRLELKDFRELASNATRESTNK